MTSKRFTCLGAGAALGAAVLLLGAAAPPKYATVADIPFTNSNGTISNKVAGSNFVLKAFGSNSTPFTLDTTVLQTNATVPLLQLQNKGTNSFAVGLDGGIFTGKSTLQDYSSLSGLGFISESFADVDVPDSSDLYLQRADSLGYTWLSWVLLDAYGTNATNTEVECKGENNSLSGWRLRASDLFAHFKLNLGGKNMVNFNQTTNLVNNIYSFDTFAYVTSNLLFKILNFGTNVFSVDFAGQVSAGSLNIGTNVSSFNFITTNLLSGQTYTNFAQRGHVVATVAMTNILAGDVSSMSLIVDQDADGTWDTTNGPVRINGVALSAGSEQLFGLLQPGARFAYTNQSAGVTPAVSIVAGSCQWSRW